ALDAVKRWRFAPARQGGRPIVAAVEVPVRFSLES
ncbi:MAG: energy transducer TonB, partial [Magnetospirillum sp.]|nr:energy transducer TonB [Magnetospirillum sp.]